MKKLSKFIRIMTVAPIFAAITTTLLFCLGNGVFADLQHYIVSLITLTAFPLIAYPLSLVKNKNERRNFQRSMAIIFAVVGYICGLIFAIATHSPSGELILYSTYLLSGLTIGFCSFVLKRKSSGHTCGIAGPVSMLVLFISPYFSFAYLLLVPVFWASLKMKRHTIDQLVSGSIIPIVCMLFCIFVIRV